MNKKGLYSKGCWLDGQLLEASIFFENGIITDVRYGKHHDAEDVGDHILMPGAIDAHVHINEPGRADWEGFDTATKAAAAGGITTLVDMPLNSSPVTTTADALQEKVAAAKEKLHVNCGFYGGLVPGNLGELKDLIEGGVLGIKAFLTHSGIDEFPNVGEEELDLALQEMAGTNVPLLAHCELTDLHHSDELFKHPASYKAYLASRPKKWENDAVDLMISLCRKYNHPVHIVHVSSAEALEKIQNAKAAGLPLTAETCPHYLLFNAEEIPDSNTLYKCAPPIRERLNNQLLKEGLVNSTLDFITTDHSPAPPAIKEIGSGDLQKAWGGISGLQFLVSAGWTSLKDEMQVEHFIPLVTSKPAEFLNISNNKGNIQVGYDADLVIWSPEESFEVKAENIFQKHKASPYVGQSLYGNIYQTYVRGDLVYGDKKIINQNKGTWLFRK